MGQVQFLRALVRPSLLLGLTGTQTLAQFHSRFHNLSVQILLSPFV